MQNLTLILMVFAFVCECLAVFPFSAPYNPRLVAAGLAFYFAAAIFGEGSRVFGIH